MKGNVVTPTWSDPITIEAYQPGNEAYEGAATRLTINVNPEQLIVAAKDVSMVYGSPVPALKYYPITIAVSDGFVFTQRSTRPVYHRDLPLRGWHLPHHHQPGHSRYGI